MDHHRTMGVIVLTNVLETEPLGQDVVKLDGAKLPLPADAVTDHEVHLRPVKRGFSRAHEERQAHVLEHGLDFLLGPPPDVAVDALELGVGRVVLGQPHAVIGEPQRAEHVLGQLHRGPELPTDLLVGAEEVGVVLCEAADPGHARELARLFVAINRAELGQSQRQVAITPRLRGVNLDVVRTVHRLEQVLLVVAGFSRWQPMRSRYQAPSR